MFALYGEMPGTSDSREYCASLKWPTHLLPLHTVVVVIIAVYGAADAVSSAVVVPIAIPTVVTAPTSTPGADSCRERLRFAVLYLAARIITVLATPA